MEDLVDPASEMNDLTSPGVILPRVECPLNEQDLASLRATIDVTRPSQSFGKDIYLAVLNFVLNRVP